MSRVQSIDGLPVTDAKRPMTLHISKRDCSYGNPKHPDTCAAAKCIKREYKAIDCRVHVSRVYIRQNNGNWLRYVAPQALRTEVIAFDRGGRFMPGEYLLSPPKPSKPRKYRAPKKGGKRKSNGHRMKAHVVEDIRNGPSNYDS